MKKTKIIVPAMGLLLLGTAASVTGTVAWFSMNTTVNIAGMQARTTVGNNLSIAADTTANTAILGDSNFSNSYLADISALLEPVSTVNGLSFFYTVNAKASGDANVDEYVAYDSGNTTAFNTAYGTTGAVGYVDYAFQLKAVNASGSAQYLNLTELNLVYNGTDTYTGINSFRVGMFLEKSTGDAFHAIGATYDHDSDAGTPEVAYGQNVLMKNAAAANFTAGKAVNSATTLGDVAYGSFNYTEIAAGETAWFKVVARLWLEGEDNKCNNGTFASLTDVFGLDLQWQLVDNDAKAAKANITNTAPLKIVAANYTVTATGAQEISEVTYNVVTGLTYDGQQVYTTQGAGTLLTTAALFTIGGETPTATSVASHFTLL